MIIVQIRKLRLGESKKVSKGLITGKQPSWDLNPSVSGHKNSWNQLGRTLKAKMGLGGIFILGAVVVSRYWRFLRRALMWNWCFRKIAQQSCSGGRKQNLGCHLEALSVTWHEETWSWRNLELMEVKCEDQLLASGASPRSKGEGRGSHTWWLIERRC